MKTKNIKAMKSIINISRVKIFNYNKELSNSIFCSPGFLKHLMMFLILFGISTLGAFAQNLNNPNKEGPLGTQVNTISGNLFIPRTDFIVLGRGFDIDISFQYNSFDYNTNFNFGNGWSFMYDIFYTNDTANSKIIKWGDGREDTYSFQQGGAYLPPRGFYDELTEYQSNKFLLKQKNGVKYFFDNPAHKKITRMEDRNGNYIVFNYTNSLLTSLQNASGQSITFAYNVNDQLKTVTDAITSPNRSFSYSYDLENNLLEATNPLGEKFKFSYLPNGPLKTLADKNDNVADIIYYNNYAIREIIGCNTRISFSYDSATAKTIAIDHMDGGTNQITTYTYKRIDNISWISSITGNCCGFNLKYEYDDQGNLLEITDANQRVTSYTYDSKGNLLTQTNALGQVSTYTYTPDFNRINSFTNPNGFVFKLTYDSKGNLIKMVTPENLVYSATYTITGEILTSVDPKGNVYSYLYDEYGNPAKVNGPDGYSATLAYDARGNLLSYSDARGNHASAAYDILDRLKIITDPINNKVKFNYDPNGNITNVINENNETTLLNYDASNRLIKIQNALGNNTILSYDKMNNLLSATNALGDKFTFEYDTRNRIKKSCRSRWQFCKL